MNSYLGKSKQEVIMAFGVPLQTASDGNNGEILIYNKSGYVPGSTGFVTPGANGTLNQGQRTYGSYYSRNVSIYVNSQGIVYHWLIN